MATSSGIRTQRLKQRRSLPREQPNALFQLTYEGVAPTFIGAPLSCGSNTAILGRVSLGGRAWLGDRAVIRADGHEVRIGDDLHLGPRSTIHIAHETLPTILGDRVAIGENAVVHACTVGSDCAIEDGAVILDGSVIAENVVIDKNSIVFPRSELLPGFLYAGMPAQPIRELKPGELRNLMIDIRSRRVVPSPGSGVFNDARRSPLAFVAHTAFLQGEIAIQDKASVWFGCDLRARDGEIVIAATANVQDNSDIVCTQGTVRIGDGTTIGHNARLYDCTVGARTLIGIGSDVAPGTVIEDDVILAAGAHTEPHQRLDSGWIWGGIPARPLAKLTDAKKTMIGWIAQTYCHYAQEYARTQFMNLQYKG